jgi:hypothetical protein
MLHHEHKRLVLVALVFDPINRLIGDHIGDISVFSDFAFGGVKDRFVIKALTGKHFPVVEASRVGAKVPLADDGGLIARFAQQLGKGHLAAVKFSILVVVESVKVTVFAG